MISARGKCVERWRLARRGGGEMAWRQNGIKGGGVGRRRRRKLSARRWRIICGVSAHRGGVLGEASRRNIAASGGSWQAKTKRQLAVSVAARGGSEKCT